MIRKEQNGIAWLEFELFQNFPRLQHAIFLRQGGVSQSEYAGLNLADHVGDNPEHVLKNQQIVQKLLQIDYLISSEQCHGKNIAVINRLQVDRPEADALVTEETNVGLVVHHADCQAAIIYDPKQHIVANVHAGWRGNVQNIYAETIHFLDKQFGSKPADLFVGIGPSLGPEHAQFINYRTEFPESFWDFQVKPDHFDLWSISEMQLIECGILPEHIEIARICTYANPSDYFSYRYCKITGRHATIAFLKV